jgi:hypothetical protein
MKFVLALLFLASAAGNPFAGRWDLTLTPQAAGQSSWPQWMELVDSGSGPQVRVQPRGGGVFPVKDVKTEGSHLTLGLPGGVKWELDIAGDRITGTQKRGDAVNAQVAGVRAPALKRAMPKAWTAPEPIFNGKDLTG